MESSALHPFFFCLSSFIAIKSVDFYQMSDYFVPALLA
jgi:hypothetical protein